MNYACTICKLQKPRSDLLARRVSFTTIKPIRIVRSRTTDWVCSDCREKDPAWTSPKWETSPGQRASA
jgi:hypothetical protein